jgi:outer membrane protein assembly factor BamB
MDSPWPMKCHDNRHTSRSPYSTADNPGIEKWRFKTDGWIDGGPVIDNDGTIYFGDFDSYLNAIYPNGTLKWKTKLDDWIWSTPAINDDGTIYIGAWDCKLYAINPDGTIKWNFSSDAVISSSPAIAEDGTIYFGNMGWYGHKIYAINPDGTEKWRYQTGEVITSDPAVGDDGIVYIGSQDNYLYALYPNGTLRWRFKTVDEIRGVPSIADDGTIYFGSSDSLYAVNPDGSLKWKVNTVWGTGGNPAIGEDGTIYVGTDKLYAINPDGSLKWSFNLFSNRWVGASSPAISADGTIYFGTHMGQGVQGDIFAVNPDGTERWRKTIANFVVGSSPCIGEDGTVYIGSASDKMTKKGYVDSVGYLHAFGSVDSNQPPEKPIITGTVNGKAGSEYFYGFSTVDPDNNPVSFYVEWGDGTSTNWSGGGEKQRTMDECASGETIYLRHVFESEGVFTIRAKARDTLSEESDWTTLTVTMPRNRLTNNPIFTKFIDGFRDWFPLFERLLNLQ